MDIWSNLFLGFQQVVQPDNLFYCFLGVLVGTLVGVLPGIGPVASISLLLPLTLKLPMLGSIIMLAGIYYGAMYGGSTTSILVNMPGEAASVVTCQDGYQMARKGRAGPALGIAAFGSFIGGTLSLVLLMLIGLPLSKLAILFGPSEYLGLMLMGMVMVIYMSTKSFLKGLVMGVFGLLLGSMGTDQITGKFRFAYGCMYLYDGIDIVPMVMGLFGISEVLMNIEESQGAVSMFQVRVKNLMPNLQDWKRSILPISRGSILGFFLGLIPGGGTVLSSFMSYALEKRISKNPDEFGHGAIEGVVGPETANNAAVGGGFVPLFALGIPSNVVMAILMSSFIVHGVTPSPGFIAKNPELFWGIICSMYVGNVMLLILNLPLIRIWIKILEVPYRILFPLILLFCVIGSYSINYRTFDILVMLVFGVLGYLLRKRDYELTPLVMAFVLGPMFEASLRQTLIVSNGNIAFVFSRPIAIVCLSISLLLILLSLWGQLKGVRERIFR